VIYVEPNSTILGPSGLKVGDVITSLNGCEVKDSRQWHHCLSLADQVNYIIKYSTTAQCVLRFLYTQWTWSLFTILSSHRALSSHFAFGPTSNRTWILPLTVARTVLPRPTAFASSIMTAQRHTVSEFEHHLKHRPFVTRRRRTAYLRYSVCIQVS